MQLRYLLKIQLAHQNRGEPRKWKLTFHDGRWPKVVRPVIYVFAQYKHKCSENKLGCGFQLSRSLYHLWLYSLWLEPLQYVLMPRVGVIAIDHNWCHYFQHKRCTLITSKYILKFFKSGFQCGLFCWVGSGMCDLIGEVINCNIIFCQLTRLTLFHHSVRNWESLFHS